MLIIGDSNAIEYNRRSTKIRFIEDDNIAKLTINGIVFASSEDSLCIQILFTRLMAYCERYRRLDDSFDIPRELKIIEKEIKRGKYNNYTIDPSTMSLKIGYPTYTS